MGGRRSVPASALVIGVMWSGQINAAVSPLDEPCEPEHVQTLLGSTTGVGDHFGNAVAVDEPWMIAGSPDDVSGSAEVFSWTGWTWVSHRVLRPAAARSGDRFGESVDLSGHMAVVGASGRDDRGLNSGSCYIYKYNGSTWVHHQKILPADLQAGDAFGRAVAMFGQWVIVGAPLDDERGLDSGSARIYRWNGSSFVLEQKLVPPNGGPSDWFGSSVDISGSIAVVGARRPISGIGAVYVYQWTGSVWVLRNTITGGINDGFGQSLSLSGGYLLAGVPYYDDAIGNDSGFVRVFAWTGTEFVQCATLDPLDNKAGDRFGESVALQGGLAVIGAPGRDDQGSFSGSAYIYKMILPCVWVLVARVDGVMGAANDLMGAACALDGEMAIVGAPGDDERGGDSGSVRVFDLRIGPCAISPATGFTVTRGTRTGGNLQSLRFTDPYRLRIDSAPGTSYHVAEVRVRLTSPRTTPSRLDLRVVTKATEAFGQTRIALRNRISGTWDQVAAYAQPRSDLVRHLARIYHASDYVDPDTGLIEVRIQTLRALMRGPFTLMINHVEATTFR